MTRLLAQTIVGFTLLCSLCGCASFGRGLKSFLGGEEKPKAQPAETVVGLNQDNMNDVPVRQYGRMTRQKLEEEAQLNPRSGSLWVPEGQGAYLFAENRARLTGDLLNVKLDGAPREQLQAKARVIRDLLKRIDAPPRAPAQANASAPGTAPSADAAKAEGSDQAAPAATPAPDTAKTEEGVVNGDDDKLLSFESIPTRVVERLNDGNYRVEGSQSFMIGKREYRVVVAGIIRAQDFNDEGVPATRILDPRFDIVSNKKGSR